jgi:hypothetical protein
MRRLTLAALVLAACGDATSPGFSTGPGVTSVSAATSGSSTSGDTSSTGTADDSAVSSAGTTTGTLRDVGTAMDFGTGQPPGCQGKVDLLFLIARTSSMDTEQAQLLASFPGFVDTIEEKLEGFDVHIMVANPDGTWPGDACETAPWGCPMYAPNCGPWAEDYVCGKYAQLSTPCDKELGAGLIFNAGGYAANKMCDLDGGNRYIVSSEPNLDEALECIAKVGSSGGDPPMGEALVAALSYNLNKPGGCNEGFLREDALLVVTMISDTDDTASFTWPYQWYDKIIAAKKDPRSVVMLGVIPQPHVEGEPYVPGCTYDSGEPPEKIRDLIEMFPYRAYGDTCASSYAPFFDEAADKIGEACGSFIPQ